MNLNKGTKMVGMTLLRRGSNPKVICLASEMQNPRAKCLYIWQRVLQGLKIASRSLEVQTH